MGLFLSIQVIMSFQYTIPTAREMFFGTGAENEKSILELRNKLRLSEEGARSILYPFLNSPLSNKIKGFAIDLFLDMAVCYCVTAPCDSLIGDTPIPPYPAFIKTLTAGLTTVVCLETKKWLTTQVAIAAYFQRIRQTQAAAEQ